MTYDEIEIQNAIDNIAREFMFLDKHRGWILDNLIITGKEYSLLIQKVTEDDTRR